MSEKVECVKCSQKGEESEMFHCCICNKGPFDVGCLANDIRHEAEDYPFCDVCIEFGYWCNDCEGMICLPSGYSTEEVFRCAGFENKECGVRLCDYCSIGGDDYSSEDYENDHVADARRRCDSCRTGMRKNRPMLVDI